MAALLEGVRGVCGVLAPHGWADLLRQHGIDITATDLKAELSKTMEVRRDVPGFEDFSKDGRRGIEPGAPARSILYHALASPNVVADGRGKRLGAFPTPAQIEAVENYVFGAAPPSLERLKQRAGGKPLGLVVFACEYRPAGDTCHRRHADLTFARTGIARVGTAPALYDRGLRGFTPYQEDDPFAIRVLPARYAAYIAVRQKGDEANFCPMRHRSDDKTRDFWLPLHKLFDGIECLADFNTGQGLSVALSSRHFNEKIRRIHLRLGRDGFDTGADAADLGKEPFVIREGIAELSTNVADDGAGLLVPVPHARLVEPALFGGKPLTLKVPRNVPALQSSLSLPGEEVRREGAPNLYILDAPEFVHVRHQVQADGTERDIGFPGDPQKMPTASALRRAIRAGEYTARHYVDFTGDGWVTVSCPQLDAEQWPPVAAYSLVAAPDFFLSCNQRELMHWWESQQVPKVLQDVLWSRDPEPLSDDRHPANLQLPNTPFQPDDVTPTAVVSMFGDVSSDKSEPAVADPLRHSCLPDDGAGLFAPGWDVSMARTPSGVPHFANHGLGSPFPEDAKLCAAISAFWPAVAPDTSRTMDTGNQTVAPLTDEENGQVGTMPWDGVPGPRLVAQGGQDFAEFASYAHADYVNSALANRFTLALTGRVGVEEYRRRVLAMAIVYHELVGRIPTPSGEDPRPSWVVLSFRPVSSGDGELQEAQKDAGSMLLGSVYRFEMSRVGTFSDSPTRKDRRRMLVNQRTTLFVDPDHLRNIFLRHGPNAKWRSGKVVA